MTISSKSILTIAQPAYRPNLSLDEILYPPLKPFNEQYVKVSDLHNIWLAEYGNPAGIPVIVLHGGPGAGCGANDMRFFDPSSYHIILFDQRGAMRSLPFGEIKENTTKDLIDDIEKLRSHLNIDQWLVFGGSWGSALAIAYGEAYPTSCLGFILRGVYLGRAYEYKQVWYGMGDIFPEAFEEYVNFLPANEQDDLITSYHDRLINPDPNIHMPAAKAFVKYDFTAACLYYNQQKIDQILMDDKITLGLARMFAHYSKNNFFFKGNELIDNLDKITHLPALIVQGRYDVICRAKSAYDLNKYWPRSELVLVPDAGHASLDLGIARELVRASEQMKMIFASDVEPDQNLIGCTNVEVFTG
jgi:proline iminopeptidase